MQKGAISVVPLIIGIAVAVIVAVALFPTIWNATDLNTCAVKNSTGGCGTGAVWLNSTAYPSSSVAMIGLAPLLIALGIGLVGVLLVLRTTGRK